MSSSGQRLLHSRSSIIWAVVSLMTTTTATCDRVVSPGCRSQPLPSWWWCSLAQSLHKRWGAVCTRYQSGYREASWPSWEPWRLWSLEKVSPRKEDLSSALKKGRIGACLVAQWLRICLPMQGTRVRALVWKDPTCCGATKPVRHNYRARAPQLLKPTCLEPMLRNKRSHRNEKPAHRNEE